MGFQIKQVLCAERVGVSAIEAHMGSLVVVNITHLEGRSAIIDQNSTSLGKDKNHEKRAPHWGDGKGVRGIEVQYPLFD